jgi:hypothetical protein
MPRRRSHIGSFVKRMLAEDAIDTESMYIKVLADVDPADVEEHAKKYGNPKLITFAAIGRQLRERPATCSH